MNDNKLVVPMKNPKGEDGFKTFSIRIKEEIVERLDTAAIESGRSRNELVGIFLEYALDNFVIKNK